MRVFFFCVGADDAKTTTGRKEKTQPRPCFNSFRSRPLLSHLLTIPLTLSLYFSLSLSFHLNLLTKTKKTKNKTGAATEKVSHAFTAEGGIGREFEKSGAVGSTVHEAVGGPFKADSSIGAQFLSDGAVGGTVEAAAEAGQESGEQIKKEGKKEKETKK